MKKLNVHVLLFTSLFLLGGMADLSAQCEDWLNPSPTSGWTDFNGIFGGAPCDDGMGCPFNEIDAFEVFAAEAYSVDGFIEGGIYTFSMCNGPGVGAWVPEFTIIAPSGAIDAFGAGDGDACSITWTASESGAYLIVINEAGECGGGPNTGTGNGYPALTCDGAPCEPPAPCVAGTQSTTGEVVACGADATVDVMTDDDEVSFPTDGGFGWSITNSTTDGTGGPDADFILTGAPTMESYNSDLNGVLDANMLPPLEGTWVFKAAVYEDGVDPFNTICDVATDSLVVNFVSDVPTLDDVVDNGDGSATVNVTGGTEPYTYEWSDGQTTQTAMGLESGTYTVVVTDANGCTVEGSVDVVVTTSVADINILTSLQIGPNPSSGDLLINFSLETAEQVRIDLIDTKGSILNSTQLLNAQNYSDHMDLSAYPNGIYLIRLVIGDQMHTERILLMQ